MRMRRVGVEMMMTFCEWYYREKVESLDLKKWSPSLDDRRRRHLSFGLEQWV